MDEEKNQTLEIENWETINETLDYKNTEDVFDAAFNYELPLVEFVNKLDDVYANKNAFGYSTKFEEYDEITGGLIDSELTVIAARHSMGKSTFALNLAVNLAQQKIPILFVSYDLNGIAVAERLVSSIAEVDGTKMKTGYMHQADWEKIASAIAILDGLNKNKYLNIYADAHLYYKDLFKLIRKFKTEHKKGVVIVDYFQLINLYRPEDTRIIELSNLAAAFKRLTMEIKMPVVLISQVNKKCEERINKRPLLIDLAECDALAQHSDNLLFIYREEYYADDSDYEENLQYKNKAEFFLAKHKNGPKKNFELLYQANIYKFKNPVKSAIF